MLILELMAVGFALGILCILAWLADGVEKDPHYRHVRSGKASWYTGSGMVAASRLYPIDSWVEVTYHKVKIKVQITSRGPAWRYFVRGRIIDLARGAFCWLENPRFGVIPVTVEPCDPPKG